MLIEAEPEELSIISQAWADVEAITGGALRHIMLRVKVGHHHFSDAERKFLGACQQKSDKSYELLLRPASSGDLYLTCIHELGHALGLKHAHRGVMSGVSRHKNMRLTPERRRRWLRDFGRRVLEHRLNQLML